MDVDALEGGSERNEKEEGKEADQEVELESCQSSKLPVNQQLKSDQHPPSNEGETGRSPSHNPPLGRKDNLNVMPNPEQEQVGGEDEDESADEEDERHAHQRTKDSSLRNGKRRCFLILMWVF